MVHFFEEMADFMGPAYLRYSFTKGTVQEVGFLVNALDLQPGMQVLDVGCGPGRHALELGRRGISVLGVDISQRFVDLGNEAAAAESLSTLVSFEHADARDLRFRDEFDAVISLCQGGFGLVGRAEDGGADDAVLAGLARAVRPGGQLALSAFSAYFQVQHLEDGDSFDAATGVNHERTEIRDGGTGRRQVDLWTTCFTPRELRLLCQSVGLSVEHVWSVTPGAYAAQEPSIDAPEFLVVARRGTAGPRDRWYSAQSL